MRAYGIVLDGHPYSEACFARLTASAATVGVPVERFSGVPAHRALDLLRTYGLTWTWANGNTSPAVCPITGLKQHPYGRIAPKAGCFLSHYLLWRMCAEQEELFLILEHDAVFVRAPERMPSIWGVCQVNDPRGATPRGDYWHEQMVANGPGVWRKTVIFEDRPDGLAGNSAYLMRPSAARQVLDLAHCIGMWPNDALMCRQLLPDLQQLYPYWTRVEQTESTSS